MGLVGSLTLGRVNAEPDTTLNLGLVLRAVVATWPRRIALAVPVVLVVVVAVLGGFARVEPRAPTAIAVGESVELGPYTVSVDSFFVAAEIEGAYLPDDAEAWLGLVLDLTPTVSEAVLVQDETFIWLDVPEVVNSGRPEQTNLLRDGTHVVRLSPGMREQVAVLWGISAPDVAGTELDLALYSMTQEESFTLGGLAWYTDDLEGVVSVPRGELPPVLEVVEE